MDRTTTQRRGGAAVTSRPRDGVIVAPEPVPEVLAQATAQLDVQFDARNTRAVSVTITCQDGLTPSDLQRFPWATFLAIADASNRGLHGDPNSVESWHVSDVMRAQRQGQPLPKLPKVAKRPGRAGHPDSFYEAVAEQYRELRSRGVTNPTKTIADKRHVARDTAAGWVRVARERGYLPPARRGRAG
jgi:hypothetical protein